MTTSTPPDRLRLLSRRALAPRAASTAPWPTTQAAAHALQHLAPPPLYSTETARWSRGLADTVTLIETADRLQLSPAGHFLLIHSRLHRNKPRRWYVVHVATAAHLTNLDHYDASMRTTAGDAELDLPAEMLLRYVDAVERLLGHHGKPVDWGVPAEDLLPELARWHDPAIYHDLDADTADHARSGTASLRELHRAAVIHTLPHAPGPAHTTATVQAALLALLDSPLPLMNHRSPAHLTDCCSRLLRKLNGGRRCDRQDQRTAHDRRIDGELADVVTRAVLDAFGGRPDSAVALLRDAACLNDDDRVHSPEDRGTDLLHIARLIGELFSPEPTEGQRLRHVTPGDLIVVVHRFTAAYKHSVEAVLQVIGPIQHLRLGTVNRDEEYIIPVNDLTYTTADNDYSSPTPAMLLVTPHDKLTLIDLSPDRRTAHQRHLAEGSAVDRWAILPAAAAGMSREALADCARAASRRASNAFTPV